MFGFFMKKARSCKHDWVISHLDHNVMVDGPVTTVYRICKVCHEKEDHWVHGEIDRSQAYNIFGNVKG
ncbi:hypothetical protein KASHIRA_01810 [Serratia phage vB_SmaM-Kashira]|nr:hypothetical protein [Acinetobacter phage ABPH49]URC22755.1 hypothetical protein KASHIRA_01810 [Serratia phage vB_SmaM-Kashira]